MWGCKTPTVHRLIHWSHLDIQGQTLNPYPPRFSPHSLIRRDYTGTWACPWVSSYNTVYFFFQNGISLIPKVPLRRSSFPPLVCPHPRLRRWGLLRCSFCVSYYFCRTCITSQTVQCHVFFFSSCDVNNNKWLRRFENVLFFQVALWAN